MYNSYTMFIFILTGHCFKATVVLIVSTEMILTAFLDFHLMSNPQVEAILQQRMFVPQLHASVRQGHETEANQCVVMKSLR